MLINKKYTKEAALEFAKQHHPEKTRVSSDFINQVNKVMEHVIEAMVRDNDQSGMTLTKCDWADRQIRKGEQVRSSEVVSVEGGDGHE